VLFAYLGKDYYPIHPFDCAAKLTIGAMVSLILCVAFGMARIQVYIKALNINREMLCATEELINFRESRIKWKTGGANYIINHKTGKEYGTIEELDKDISLLQTRRDKDHHRMEKWFKWATHLFIACHLFLAAGFVLLVCAKLV
jgi:hypothetical protein